MLEGVVLLWLVLAVPSFRHLAMDFWRMPAATVIEWAFVIVAAYTGLIGAFFCMLGCREPLRRADEGYVSVGSAR